MPLLPVYIEALGYVLSHHTVQFKMEQKHRLQALCILLFSHYLELCTFFSFSFDIKLCLIVVNYLNSDSKEKGPSCRAVAVFFIGAQTVIVDPVEYADFIGEIGKLDTLLVLSIM